MNVFTPAETAANYAAAGVLKTRQPFLKLLLLGIAAGALIGFPVCVTNMATYAITNASAVRIIAGVLFAFGLGIVVLTGAELFTGNTLLVISLLDRRVTWGAMLRNWGVVYLGNFLGALALSWVCARFGWLDAGDGALGAYTMQLAVGKMTMPFGKAFFMGVLCNILVTVADVLCGGRLQPLHRRHDLLCAGPVRQVRPGLRRNGAGRRRGPVRPDLGALFPGEYAPRHAGKHGGRRAGGPCGLVLLSPQERITFHEYVFDPGLLILHWLHPWMGG